MSILETRHLSVERGGRVLLGDLNVQIGKGSICVVIGPNGAGKSSLLMALAGVIDASGECLIEGSLVAGRSRAELSGLLAWQGELPPTEFGLTVRERLNLAAGAHDKALLSEAIKTMNLEELLLRSLDELSSGERQRVEIASVMVRDCPLWLFDEPTSHLDLKHQMTVLKMFSDQAAKGRTIVTVLHDLQQATAVADCVILLDGHGGAEAGEAVGLLTEQRLSSLFQVKLKSIHSDEHTLLLPDYQSDRQL